MRGATSSLSTTRLAVGAALSWVLTSAICSCSSIVWDERANGCEITVDVDDVFTISLPHPPGNSAVSRGAPEIAGQAIRFLTRGIDEHDDREWFKFGAAEAGDAEISIFTRDAEDRGLRREYTLKVKVRICEW